MTIRSIIIVPLLTPPAHTDYAQRGASQALMASGLVSTVLSSYGHAQAGPNGRMYGLGFRFTVDTETPEAADRAKRMLAGIIHAATGHAATPVAWTVGEVAPAKAEQ